MRIGDHRWGEKDRAEKAHQVGIEQYGSQICVHCPTHLWDNGYVCVIADWAEGDTQEHPHEHICWDCFIWLYPVEALEIA